MKAESRRKKFREAILSELKKAEKSTKELYDRMKSLYPLDCNNSEKCTQ